MPRVVAVWTASFRHVSTQLFPPGRGEIARSIIHIPVGGVNLAGEQGSCAQPAVMKLSVGAARGASGSKQCAALPAISCALYCSDSKDCAWQPDELSAVGRPSAAVCAIWSVLACSPFLKAAVVCRRPGRRSRHVDRTRIETGHMASTNASDIRGVHCRPQVLTIFRSCVVGELLPALYECWLLSLTLAWLCGLVVRLIKVIRPGGKSKCRSVRRHPGLCMHQRPRRRRQQAKRSLAGRACAPMCPCCEDCCAHYCSGSRDCAW